MVVSNNKEPMKKILFVCLGNICRSPAAEGVLKQIIKNHKRENDFYVDSAGTSAYHQGAKADKRMIAAAKKREIDLTSLSRPFEYEDFQEFDYIVAMDKSNFKDILSLDQKNIYSSKVFLMTDFTPSFPDVGVPDPYFGGEAGFDYVLDLLEEGCTYLYKKISTE